MEKSSGNISKIREIANERGMTLAFISKKLGKSSGYSQRFQAGMQMYRLSTSLQ